MLPNTTSTLPPRDTVMMMDIYVKNHYGAKVVNLFLFSSHFLCGKKSVMVFHPLFARGGAFKQHQVTCGKMKN
jgi:hypothetical protein